VANSVSKINIVVGASTGQLQAGMNQAAATVQRGMGNIQSVAQAATFAVDDFFAAFATGGVSGGLRGAGNNLTQIASMLGGIKVQLAVIAGLAVGQLLIKQFEGTTKSIDKADKALAEFQERLKRGSAVAGSEAKARQTLREIAGGQSLPDMFRQRNEGRTSLADLQSQLAAETKRLADLDQLRASVIGDEATKAVVDEIAERKKAVREIRDEIREQERLNEAIEKRLRLLQGRRMDEFYGSGAFGGSGGSVLGRARAGADIAAIDKEIAALRDSMRPSLSLADMFRMMPGANAMGSAGAISAINAARIGPQNARDSGPALTRETNRILSRIEDLERKKTGIVEAFAL
jgi:hypothetical protein